MAVPCNSFTLLLVSTFVSPNPPPRLEGNEVWQLAGNASSAEESAGKWLCY